MARVVLIETVNPGRFHSGKYFPFAKGLLHAKQVSTRWLRFAVPANVRFSLDADGFDLDDHDRAALFDVLAEHNASHVVFSHRPASALAETIRERIPGCSLGLLSSGDTWTPDQASDALEALRPSGAKLLAWLGVPPLESLHPASEDLLAYDEPRYDFEDGNRAAEAMEHFMFLLCGAGCTYRRPVDTSRFLASVVEENGPDRWGCSFCNEAVCDSPGQVGRKQAHARLQAQLTGVKQSMPTRRLPLLLRIGGALVTADPEALANAVVQADLPRARILIEIRADDIVHRQSGLEKAAALLGEHGNRLDVCLVGVESFSSEQLDRFHKGYGPHVNLQAIRILRTLERALPDAFGFRTYGGLSTILYDPWVTIGEVALNLAVVRHFELQALCGKLLTSRLRLFEGLPLTRAAREQGLIVESYEDLYLDTAKRNFYGDELPWRFADERVDSLNRLTTRLAPEAGEADALSRELGGWGRERALSPLDRAWQLCVAAGRSERALTPDELLARARTEPLPATEVRDTRGEQVSDWLTNRWEARAFEAGFKPVIKVEDGIAPEVQDAIARALSERYAGLSVVARTRRWGGQSTRELFAGRDEALVREALALTEARDGELPAERAREAIERTGSLLGYPPCCAQAFSRLEPAFLTNNEWLIVRRRLEAPAEIDARFHPRKFCYVPCSFTCSESLARLEQIEALGPSLHAAHDDLPTLMLLDRVGEFMHVQPVGNPEPPFGEAPDREVRLPYRLVHAKTADARYEPMSRGDTLAVQPGLVRIIKDGQEIGFFALDAFLWWHEGVAHAPFWQECVQQLKRSESRPRKAMAEQNAPNPHFARALSRALGTLAAKRPGLFGGYRVERVEAGGSDGALARVELMRQGRALVVELFSLDARPEAFLRGERFCATYGRATPVRTEQERRVVELLLRVFEKVV